jgi:hypothetical protein
MDQKERAERELRADVENNKVYEYTAHQILGDVSGTIRSIGKVFELGLGYQMGADTLLETILARNIPDFVSPSLEGAQRWVDKWRAANPNIVSFWYDLDGAAKSAIRYPGEICPCRRVSFQMRGNLSLRSGFKGRADAPVARTIPPAAANKIIL